MNNPYATQTQIEARIAARLNNADKFRRALRLDNPHMFGIWAEHAPGHPDSRLPTPTYK